MKSSYDINVHFSKVVFTFLAKPKLINVETTRKLITGKNRFQIFVIVSHTVVIIC